MQLVTPGVYTLTGLIIGRVFLIVEDDGLTLIDTSMAFAVNRIVNQITAAGHTLTDLKRILITHGHIDHIGGLPRLKALTGARVIVPAGDRALIEAGQPAPAPAQETLPGIWRVVPVPPLRCPPAPVDQVVEEGDVLDVLGGLHVLHVPGHTPGHAAYWQPERRVLFCGDVIMRFGGPNLRLPFAAATPDMAEDIRSVGKLAALEPDVLCMGHGQPIAGGAAPAVRAFAQQIGALS
ncbi:MAG: MBL fold metallo-hydrolase [Anaerolineae bacterium]|nr:MBL fold metallo-hydrolase [Anaerolineae bacterium]